MIKNVINPAALKNRYTAPVGNVKKEVKQGLQESNKAGLQINKNNTKVAFGVVIGPPPGADILLRYVAKGVGHGLKEGATKGAFEDLTHGGTPGVRTLAHSVIEGVVEGAKGVSKYKKDLPEYQEAYIKNLKRLSLFL